MGLVGYTKEKLIELREALIGEYIGTWNKPQSYFKKLEEMEQELMKRQGIIQLFYGKMFSGYENYYKV